MRSRVRRGLTDDSSEGRVTACGETGDQDASQLDLVSVVDIVGPLDGHRHLLRRGGTRE